MGRKFFHCLGAPNNLIRPWFPVQSSFLVITVEIGYNDMKRVNVLRRYKRVLLLPRSVILCFNSEEFSGNTKYMTL